MLEEIKEVTKNEDGLAESEEEEALVREEEEEPSEEREPGREELPAEEETEREAERLLREERQRLTDERERLAQEARELCAREQELRNREKDIVFGEKKLRSEQERFRKGMDYQNKKLQESRKKLNEDNAFFEKKMDILKSGFIQLEADKKAVKMERMRLDAEREAMSGIGIGSDDSVRLFFRGVSNLLTLKKRYKDLIKIFHPDNLCGDTELLQKINRVYESLLDEIEWQKKA